MQFVMTTINAPTRAVEEFAALDAIDGFVVVGDRKTPPEWSFPGVQYLGPDTPVEGSALQPLLPFNHYARKNLGYLEAMSRGGPIAESDDDNIPYAGWSFPAMEGAFATYRGDARGIVNQYRLFSEQQVWPRGLPLGRINDAGPARSELVSEQHKVGVWQGLANGDPDVDAIYRLSLADVVTFDEADPVVFVGPAAFPINSQNTLWAPELYPCLYLPSYVTFRYTDILRGYVAAAVAQSFELAVGVSGATVFQDRNEHDLMKDFESEVPMFLTGTQAFELSLASAREADNIAEAVRSSYLALEEAGIVDRREIGLVDAWLSDVARFSGDAA